VEEVRGGHTMRKLVQELPAERGVRHGQRDCSRFRSRTCGSPPWRCT
jgi:hypothetical protein